MNGANERLDPFDVLVAVRPPADRQPLDIGELPDAEALLARIIDADAPAPPIVLLGRRRRRMVVVGGVVVGSLAAASAAAAVWWQNRSDDRGVVSCWSAAPSPEVARFEVRVDTGDDPIEACAVLWVDGTFATAGQPASQVCLNADGTSAVIPGDATTCVRAGLEPIERATDDSGPPDDIEAAQQLSFRLAKVFVEKCLGEDASRAAASSALADEQLHDWSVVVSVTFSTERPCGSATVSPDTRTIVIAAVPSDPGGGG